MSKVYQSNRKKTVINIVENPDLENAQIIEEKLPNPIFYGIATTNITNEEAHIQEGEQVNIYSSDGDEWVTDKGNISKLFLLLRRY